MALTQAFATLLLLIGSCLGFASLGTRILRSLQFQMTTDGETFVVSVALGILATEILVFLTLITQYIRQGCLAVLALLCIFAILEWKSVWVITKGALRQLTPPSPLDRPLLFLVAVVVSLQFLASQAPLTGSDALHYHFQVQTQIIQHGFHPDFSSSHSFLSGQHHLLILFGLALGSEHLAMGFIFLGGIFTAASLALLISRATSYTIVAVFSLLFLLTPVVFWQISTSGSPDIFMAFFVSVAVLVLRQETQSKIWRVALLAGLLAGGIAGAKYTGCLLAFALAVAFAVEFRSVALVSLFFLASLFSGIWPYLRNLSWTGNPIFPFFSARLSPQLVTPYALKVLASDTGASSGHDPLQAIPFIFFAAFQKNNAGFWDFFGPVVLMLAPLILLAFRNSREWRVPILVWFLSGLAIFFASGLPRFLLPIFPVALSCVAGGLQATVRRSWTILGTIATCLLTVMIVAGAGGLVIYARDPLRTAIGLQSKSAYLEQRSQDYQIVEAVNRLLAGLERDQNTLVFIRHLYYLNIAYLNGDPDTSFEVDPDRMQTAQDWKSFFKKYHIAYIVRAPQYPKTIAEPLRQMEQSGDLLPYATTEVENWRGKRMDEERVAIQVVILKVNR